MSFIWSGHSAKGKSINSVLSTKDWMALAISSSKNSVRLPPLSATSSNISFKVKTRSLDFSASSSALSTLPSIISANDWENGCPSFHSMSLPSLNNCTSNSFFSIRLW